MKKLRFISLHCVLFLLVSSFAFNGVYAQENLDEQLNKLRDYVNSVLEDSKVPGLALGIVKDGEVVLTEGFGYRDLEKKMPVTPKTLFAIGSCTKAFTTLAIGLLVDEGSIEWDKPVRDYLPGFQLKDPYITANMTVRDIVTHRSGLPRHDGLWYGSPLSRMELFKKLRYLDFSAGFREKYQYNNLMYMTAGMVAGAISGSTWEQAVQKRILDPLGMTNSNFSVNKSMNSSDFAVPYRIDDENGEKTVTEIPFRNIDTIGPAGSINSCVDDMMKWVQLHIDRGKLGEEQFISESTIVDMHTPHMHIAAPMSSNERSHSNYGLAWGISMYRGHKLVQHSGGIDGFTTYTSFMPFDSIGVFVVNNAASGISGMITTYAYDLLLGKEPVDRYARMKERLAKAEEEEQSEQEEDDRVEGTSPSHKLADYAGRYEHPAYGLLSITSAGGKLSGKYNAFEFGLEHWHYDVFKTTDDVVFDDMTVSFLTDEKGSVESINVPLEPQVKPIVFKRKPDEKFSTPEYLSQFVGEYLVGPLRIVVELRSDNVLIAKPEGQPQFAFVPLKENEFSLKGLTDYSSRFDMEDGMVSGITLFQPNGTFSGKKVK